jgi:hypothetical protein
LASWAPLAPKHTRNSRVADSWVLTHGDVVVKPAGKWGYESYGHTSNARKRLQAGQAKWSIRYAEPSTPPALGLFVVEIRDPLYRMQVRNDAHGARVELALIAHTASHKVVRRLLRTLSYG